jgi:hypothetical protein
MASTEIENLDPAETVDKLNKIAAGRALNRRHFIAALGMTGAAAGAGLMSGCNATTSPVAITTPGAGQADILNFALNLQYLEATLYSYITQGADLPASVRAGSGAITGAPGLLTFAGGNAAQGTDLLNEIYFDELNHVIFLRNLLGASLVPRPAINLAAFGAITATNALSIGRLLEDVGVTACATVAAGLSSSSATYAGQLLGAESFHAGALRLLSIQANATAITAADGLDVLPADIGITVATTGPTASGGFFTTYGGAAVAGTSGTNGFAIARTTSQVLAVLYGAPTTAGTAIVPASSGTSVGGFFPNGVNGKINTV